MKAKDLAKILLQNPEAEVCFVEHFGGYDEAASVNETDFYKQGEITKDEKLVHLAHKEGKLKGVVKSSFYILKHNTNKK